MVGDLGIGGGSDARRAGREMTEVERHWIKLNDRRLLIIYLLITAVLVAVIYWVQHKANEFKDSEHQFDRQIVHNCQQNNKGFQHFNATLDQLIEDTSQTAGLDEAQKAKSIKVFNDLKLPISPCPIPSK
jgi:predicted negative regulator of RcsB-dependent stress response